VVNGGRDPLYLMYTSGSTGLPKGALIRHDGALNHMFAEFRLLHLHAESAFLQSAPVSSDISVWQCLGPLLVGGRVVFADYEHDVQSAGAVVVDPARADDTDRTGADRARSAHRSRFGSA
jgi:non-ribosomal peptide synthetase component F